MSHDDLQAIRVTARHLAGRIQTDETFKARVEQDPLPTLLEAGLPEKAIPSFLYETGLSDVSGYIAHMVMYCAFTCVITE